MKYLGIDWGEKKIGLATGEDETKIASPFLFLRVKNRKEGVEKIKKVIVEENIDAMVIGRPNKMNGDFNISKSWQNFVDDLAVLAIPIFEEDERLTSVMAQKISFDIPKNKKNDDLVAATIILQTYFDKIR